MKAQGGNSLLLFAPAYSNRRLSLAGIKALLSSHQSLNIININIAFLSQSTNNVKLRREN